MKNVVVGIIIGIIGSIIIYLFYKEKKKLTKLDYNELDNKWLEVNKHIMGMKNEDLIKIFGEGTKLNDHEVFYLSEWEETGRVQNIYSFNEKEEVSEILLNIKNTGMTGILLNNMRSLLGEPYIDNRESLVWRDGKLEYKIACKKDLLEININMY